MRKIRPITLLLTATITPPLNCPDLKRNDPEVRLNDYYDALRFYLAVPKEYIDKIVFVENSGSDLSRLRNLVEEERSGKQVEFLEYVDGNSFPPEYGKGYGEMLILNYALDNSKIISDDDVIWKATGRLILSNIQKLIASTPEGAEVYCDLHDSFKVLSLEYFFDPRFYAFTKRTYNKYFRLSENELRFVHIEHKYFHVLKKAKNERGVFLRFKFQPQIKGYVAAVDGDYSTFRKKSQRAVQQLFRFWLPSVWL